MLVRKLHRYTVLFLKVSNVYKFYNVKSDFMYMYVSLLVYYLVYSYIMFKICAVYCLLSTNIFVSFVFLLQCFFIFVLLRATQ